MVTYTFKLTDDSHQEQCLFNIRRILSNIISDQISCLLINCIQNTIHAKYCAGKFRITLSISSVRCIQHQLNGFCHFVETTFFQQVFIKTFFKIDHIMSNTFGIITDTLQIIIDL
ncbi:hypothetical protein D3C80_1899330 [compost metagenome]